jgi:hypothetical protein
MVRVDRCVRAMCVVFFALAVLLLIPFKSFAQNVANAEVSGQVLDPTGAAVPDATVTMTEADKNVDHTTQTDSDGHYLFPGLPVGPYKLTVAKSSFKSYVQTGIVLQVNDHVALNVSMQLGAVSESVVVQAGAIMVQTDTAAVSNVVTGDQINNLPLNGRFASELISMAGVSSPYQQSSPTSGYGDLTGSKSFFSSFAVSVAGSQYNGVNYLLDGGMNNDTYAFVNLPFPFPDALAEFSVETDALPAQTGTKAGGVVNVVTKSGTNTIHGDLFEYLRNGDFNARAHPFFTGPQPGTGGTLATNCQADNPSNIASVVAAANAAGTSGNTAGIQDGGLTGNSCDILRRNQFGGTAGGKIIKDKLFWFMGYQGTRISQVGGATTNEPTQDEIQNGDLAPYFNDLESSKNLTGNTTNYWAGQANCTIKSNATSGLSTSLATPTPYFGGAATSTAPTVDPGDTQDRLQAGQSFDPIALKLFGAGLVPYGPGQGTNPSMPNYNPCGYLTYSVPSVQNEDQVIGRIDDVISAKQTLFGRYFIDDFTDPDANTLAGGTNLLLTSSPGVFQRAQAFTLGDNYSVSPTSTNSLHLTWNRRRDNRTTLIPLSLSTLGATTYTETNAFLLVTGPFSIGSGTGNLGHFNVNSWQASDDIDLIRGRNHFTMGVDLIRTQDNTLSNYDNDGTLGFGTTFTGNALGDFLMGAWSTYSQSRPQQVAFRATFPAVYFQDVLRVHNDLTINMGLRWEPELFPYDLQGRGATFNLQSFLENVRSPQYASDCTPTALAANPNACPPAGFFFYGDPNQGKAYSSSKILMLAPRIGLAWNPFGSQKQVFRVGGGIFNDDAAVWWSQRLTSDPPGIDEIDLSQSLSSTATSSASFCGTLSHPWLYYTPAGCQGSPSPANLNGGTIPAGTFPDGPFPAVHDFPSGALWVVIPPEVKPTYVAEWTASYQFQFAANWVATVSYLGNKSTHLPLGYSINFSETPNENLGQPNACFLPGANSVATSTEPICANGNENQRQYLNLLAGGSVTAKTVTTNLGVNELSGQMEMGTDSNNANYNALLATLQHRFGHGFTWNANYTYSHCFDEGEAQGDLNGNTFYQNQLNFAGNYGSCTFDIRSLFNSNVVASTTLKHGWKGELLGGWQVVPNVRFVSGAPLNFTIGDASLTGGSSQATFEDFAPGCNAAGAYSGGLHKNYSWLNQSCLLVPALTSATGTTTELVNPVYTNSACSVTVTAGGTCPTGDVVTVVSSAGTGSGQFGTIQRNYLRAPGAINFDMSISRMFPIHERLQAEFRFDAFNVLNHWNPAAPSAGSPTGTTGSQNLGFITSAALSGIIPVQTDPRVLQFAVKFHW